jgi:hypothetical protein
LLEDSDGVLLIYRECFIPLSYPDAHRLLFLGRLLLGYDLDPGHQSFGFLERLACGVLSKRAEREPFLAFVR